MVYAFKQFCRYLLGRSFQFVTDHVPLQWLSVQKMEDMLCPWALAMQEYDFQTVYRKGTLNANADALSRCNRSDTHTCAATSAMSHTARDELRQAQQTDSHMAKVIQACTQSPHRPTGPEWWKQPLQRYRQLWSQLRVVDGTLYRHFAPGPTSESVTVPILPASLRKQALLQNHDAPSPGHQGPDRTLERLHQEAYWVNMARDVEKHCRECTTCQQTMPPAPQHVPHTNTPIRRPWQMVAVDILEVPVSFWNNRYLLVVQDYFTKWMQFLCEIRRLIE